MSADLERQIQELQEENRKLRQALEQKTKVANRALVSYQQRVLHMEIIRQQNEDLDKLTIDLAQAKQHAEDNVRREQVIRQIIDKLRTAPNLELLLEMATRELGQRLGAKYTVLEVGIETNADGNGRT